MMNFNSKYPNMSRRRDTEQFKQFKRDALAFAGISESCVIADDLFDLAWEESHSYGLNQVVSSLLDLGDIADKVDKAIAEARSTGNV